MSNIFIISGPTGSGENTLCNEITKKFPVFKRLVAATTRPKRSGENDGTDYYFFSKERFLSEIKNGNIIEYTYVKNRDTYYGSYKPDLDKKISQGFNVVATPDLVGTKYFKEKYGATTVFIDPGSLANLKRRIENRNPEISQAELDKRMENAEAEIRNEKRFYDYVILNEDGKLEEAVNQITDILKKENYKLSK